MERSTRETLTASERSQLARVNRALSKLENGTYGLSDITGEPIPVARLEALPWATTNVEDESSGPASAAGSFDHDVHQHRVAERGLPGAAVGAARESFR